MSVGGGVHYLVTDVLDRSMSWTYFSIVKVHTCVQKLDFCTHLSVLTLILKTFDFFYLCFNGSRFVLPLSGGEGDCTMRKSDISVSIL